MKRYLLFIYSEFNKIGGWYDLQNDYDDLKEAIKIGDELLEKRLSQSEYHIIDTHTKTCVFNAFK